MPGSTTSHPAALTLAQRSAEVRSERSAIVKRIVAHTRRAQGVPDALTDNQVLELVAKRLERDRAVIASPGAS